jgi:multidrug efflux pump subunit AcrA (membrane-fusion protein)
MRARNRTAAAPAVALVAAAALAVAGCGGTAAPPPVPEKATLVEVELLGPETVREWLDLAGTIEPLREVSIIPEVGGLLEWRGPREGDRVRRGERLALVDRERLELLARQAELAVERGGLAEEAAAEGARQAEAALAQAEELERKLRAVREKALADRDRARTLLAEQLAPRSYAEGFETALAAAEADLAAAASGVAAARSGVAAAGIARRTAEAGRRTAEAAREEARLFLRRSEVLAPIDGYLARTLAEQGEVVEANKPVLVLVATRSVKAVFPLAERDAPLVRTGAPAAVTVASLGPEPIAGTVTLLAVTADPATSTYRLEVELPNADGRLRAGMLAQLRLLRREVTGAVAAPLFAVMRSGGASHAYVLEDGVARRREVVTGIVNGDRVEIRSGLAAGDRLIVKGQRDLEDGQKVALP